MNRLFVAERDRAASTASCSRRWTAPRCWSRRRRCCSCFLVAVELVALPAYAVLLLGPSPWQAMPELLVVLALADLGIAVVGTLFGALGIRTGAPDLIVPIITLPLLLPIVIGAAQATAPLLLEGGAEALSGRWLASLGLYDMVFALIALAVFDFLLED